MKRFGLAIALATAVATAGLVAPNVGTALGAPARAVARTSALSRWATPANFVRAARSTGRVHFAVVLGWRDAAAVASFAAAVSDPKNAAYGHFLSAAQFRTRFAQPDSAVSAVAAWLRGSGLSVGAVPANHLYVPASGTVEAVQRALGVRLNMYRTAGRVTRAPASEPAVPATVGAFVRGFMGLSTTHMRHFAAPPAGFRVGNPCSQYWGQKMATTKPQAYGSIRPYTPCGYNPQQMRGAYGVAKAIKSGIDGRGQTVAIIDAYFAPTIRADLTTYSHRHGLPAPKLKQFIVPPAGGNAGEKQGWYGEETLDLEAVHSMAPGANLVYEGAYSSADLDILNRVVDVIDNHRASIVTNSYGNIGEDVPPAEVAAEEAAYQQAISEGIAFLFSSGDCGDEIDPQGICGGLGTAAADFPASSPSVTAVGGTSLAVGANNSYLFETGWGTAWSNLSADGLSWDPAPGSGYFFYGSGGGTSQLFAEPSYQQGVVPDALAGRFGGSGRVVPDIATDGDPNTGFTIGETQTWPDGSVSYDEFRLGGTSLSSPLLAGILALANQRAGHALGFINPRLYEDLAGTNALRDIIDPASTVAVVRTNFNNSVDGSAGRSYSLRTMNQDGTLVTTPGYDDVTGLGTPNGWKFLNALAHE